MKVTVEDIRKARELLKDVILPTELSYSTSASQRIGTQVYFKYENTQRTGSFKIRGAFNKISNMSAEEKKRGVVASSAGNHAQGVALSATLAKVQSTIVMPENAPLTKINATRGYGANVVLKGEIYDEAYEYARHLEKEKSYVFVHPYEDPYVIAGQGTIGLEIAEKLPDLDSIVVPIGGGGLISGISLALKSLLPKVKVIGVQSNQAPGMSELFHHKTELVPKKKISTIADGIAIKHPSKIMYENFISKYVDEIVTVSDDEIAEAIVFLLERAKTLTEGSGAAAMAAALNKKLDLGKKTCIMLCGGNVDLNVIAKIIDKGQIQRGRLAALSIVVDDLPGSLYRLTRVMAEQKANILEVHHDRISQGLSLRETRIDFVIEANSPEHIESIRQALVATGGRIL